MSVFNSSRLVGKTVVITGASAGIGAATALLFAKAGSNLILLARRTEPLNKVAEACSAVIKDANHNARVFVLQFDVSDKAQVAGLLEKIPEGLREVDILVNNAGFVKGREEVGDIADQDVEDMFSTNVLGLVSITQLFVKEFKKRQTGHIINIGSIAGREPYAGGSIYTATKHAVHAFSASMMRELVNTPIRVTEIQPGMVETEFSIVRFRGDKGAADKVYEGLEPLTAEDIAEEIVWSASRPPHVNLAEVFVLPVNQASATLSHRASK
jgi:3-hydroxy acid dehydrogenase/malonic semialdehyde reductase